jgi:predicted phosphoribosyltransferase
MKTGYFPDRTEAGRVLATKLAGYMHRVDVLVLVLPRGRVRSSGDATESR